MDRPLIHAVVQLTQAEAGIIRLAPLSKHIEPSSNLSLGDLVRARIFFALVSSKAFDRIQNTKNAVIFNISGRESLEKVKQTVIKARNTNHYPSHCVKLRTMILHKSCPLLMRFQSGKSPVNLSEKYITAENMLFKTISIAD